MKINNTNLSVNFKGMYIVKGSNKDIETISNAIELKANVNANKWYSIPKKDALQDYDELHLVPDTKFTNSIVERLFFTNKHCSNFKNYCYYNNINDIMELDMNEICSAAKESGNITKTLRKVSSISNQQKLNIQEVMNRDEFVMRKLENGNISIDKYLDFFSTVRDYFVNYSRKTIDEIKKVASVPFNEVAVLDAKDVLKAVKNDSFDFVNGRIIEN